jgi:predicted nucleic acid-binding protein
MDQEEVLKAGSLLGGQLNNRREEIKRNLVKLTISEFEHGSEISVEDIQKKCRFVHDVEFDTNMLRDFLNELGGEYVVSTEEDKYKIISRPEFDEVNEQIKPLWDEFENILHLHAENPDPYFKHKIRPAFDGFFEKFMGEIVESIKELGEFQKDTVYTYHSRTEELIEEVADDHNITEKNVFKEAIEDYLSDPGEKLLDFTESCYTTAINVDLIAREEDLINFPEIPDKNSKLIMDTNVLVALLADTDRQHELARIACGRTDDLDFELYYTDETENELRNLINRSENEMNGVYSGDKKIGITNNQFVKDYSNKPDISWDEYINEIKNWKEILEEKYGITKFEFDKEPNQEVVDKTRGLLLQDKQYNIDDGVFRSAQHDSKLMGIAAAERKATTWDFGPFVLSFHNKLTSIGSFLGKDDDMKIISGGKPLALHTRSWLNYIMSFTPVELTCDDKNEIAQSIIQIASDFEEEVTWEQFSHTFAPKVGLENADEESLRKFLANHPELSDGLQEAVDENAGHRAEQISREILTDEEYIETIQEEREFKDRIRGASDRINQLEEEIDELESKLDGEIKDFRSKYEEAISDFQSNITEAPKLNIEEPPSADADISNIKDWLQVTAFKINSKEELSDEMQTTGEEIELLLSDAISIENR